MNMRLRLAGVATSLLGVLVVCAPARAAVKEIRLGVKGATCATCAFALRKTFQKLDGVASAKLTTKPAYMHVTMKPGQWPDVAKMQEAIRLAGFEAVKDQVELVVTGTVVQDGATYQLSVEGKAPLRLPLQASPAAQNRFSFEGNIGREVQLEGVWRATDPATPGAGTLLVTSLRSGK